MKRSQTTVIIILSAVGVLLLVYFAYTNASDKRFQWNESYDATHPDLPYGTLYLHKMLEEFHPGGTFVFNEKKPLRTLLAGTDSTTDYIFVGPSIYLDRDDLFSLVDFIERGNEVFIASNDLPRALLDVVYTDTCADRTDIEHYKRDSEVTLNFFHDSLRTARGYTYAYRIGTENVNHEWASATFKAACDAKGSMTPLGFQYPGGINFFRIRYGKGSVFIHTNPVVFTNYFLTKPQKLAYVSGVFGHLKKKNIILDEYSKLPFSQNDNSYYSPLYFILRQPSLKYAWWMLLATVVLYAVFAARRTQRVIPVIDKKTNTSLEFIHLISTLHFRNGNPLDMARKKMRYFLYVVRSRYGIQSPSFTEGQMLLLSEKSSVSLPEIKTIFKEYDAIEKNAYFNTQSDKLLRLFNAIENFKRKCK